MKYLKLFESFSQDIYDDITIIYEIFDEKSYENPYQLEKDISRISDPKLKLGIAIEFFAKSDEYGIEKEDLDDIMTDLHNKYDIDGNEAHDYYVDMLNEDIRSKFYEFIYSGTDLGENQEFIDWIKSLSDKDAKRIEEICIDQEIYELITFMRSLRIK